MDRKAYCVSIVAECEGMVPSVFDEKGRPVLFATQREAELEIADCLMTRLQELIEGEREFEDAITVEEFVMEVEVLPDGSIIDSDGNRF